MRKSLIETQNVMVAVGGKMHLKDGYTRRGEEMDWLLKGEYLDS